MATNHDKQQRIWIGAPTHRRLKAMARRKGQALWKLATVYLRSELDREDDARKARRDGR